jgi:hypothetical protein
MLCEYCTYKNSWDCGDGWNKHKNCDSFKLEWDFVPDDIARIVIMMLKSRENDYE